MLSGHDHNQCRVVQSTPFGPVMEQTLGTISWQQGNLYPSFMLIRRTNCKKCVIWAKSDDIGRDLIKLSKDVMT
ncbi:unnamed protein product [Triticum turgidum subsp. durum]|uniref:Uncharacterized protein n=1 Tax=Triticum turgidum subsp. durum TaxID=4567 RepID=A0A9R0WAQ1_TRITD|nr:unnamed protein product [Triticum turgidum subsp. durum]